MAGKTGLLFVMIVAAAAVIYSVVARLSDQTIDVLVGLMCGVGATIPICIGLLIALTRRRHSHDAEEETEGIYPERGDSRSAYNVRQPYPPVIVVTPQQSQLPHPFGGMLPPGYNLNEPPIPRNFKIVGEDDDG
jgi:hypothetical protein